MPARARGHAQDSRQVAQRHDAGQSGLAEQRLHRIRLVVTVLDDEPAAGSQAFARAADDGAQRRVPVRPGESADNGSKRRSPSCRCGSTAPM